MRRILISIIFTLALVLLLIEGNYWQLWLIHSLIGLFIGFLWAAASIHIPESPLGFKHNNNVTIWSIKLASTVQRKRKQSLAKDI